MSPCSRALIVLLALAAAPAVGLAQSPTLPSDTLEANYAPRSVPGPNPELAPSLPSDTLQTGAPLPAPGTEGGEMRRDWDQGEEAGEPWKTEDEVRLKALEFRVG